MITPRKDERLDKGWHRDREGFFGRVKLDVNAISGISLSALAG